MSDYDSWKTRSDLDDHAAHNHPEPQEDEPELFSVVQFFNDLVFETVRRDIGAREAVEAAHYYTHNVAAKLGMVARVVITDQGDNCCFEWRRGEGVTFPEEMRGRQ